MFAGEQLTLNFRSTVMKLVLKQNSLVTRLAMVAAVMLFSQQATAAGTAAGSTIANQARVDYDVGLIPQEFILSDPAGNSTPGVGGGGTTDFLVDNRVDFTLVEDGVIGPTNVAPNQMDNVTTFLLRNTGNQTQGYQLIATNLATVDGNMNNLRAFSDSDASGDWTPADTAFVDSLGAETEVLVFIVADADTVPALVNGNVADVDLQAITADAGTSGATITTATVGGDTAAEDVVLAVGGVNGTGDNNAQDSYEVVSAELQVTKISTLIDDPFNGTTDPYLIPGATVEYLITVENLSATTDAVNVSVSELLADVTLVLDPFATGNDVEVLNNAVVVPCAVGAGLGCSLVAGTLTVAVTAAPITVTLGTSMTIRFHVTID